MNLTPAPVSEGSLCHVFDLIGQHLPPELMNADSFAHTRKVADLFAVEDVDFFGFEARLGAATSNSTDCALNLSRHGARAMEQGVWSSQGGSWPLIAEFYRHWGATHVDPFADAPATWLEFDCTEATPAPNLMFGYFPDDANSDRPWTWMQDVVLSDLFRGAYGQTLRAGVDRVFEALPAGTGDLQIGVMLSRPLQALRLCVFDVEPDRVPSVLKSIDWRGDIDAVTRLVKSFGPHCDFVGIHLDIMGPVLPHIGIEPNFTSGSWARQPHLESRWQGLFDVLQAEALLTDAKRQALMSWTGHQALNSGGKQHLLLRGLSHLKVVLDAKGAGEAKGYFGTALRVPRPPVEVKT